MNIFNGQFLSALNNIEVNGEKREKATAAHTEIQELLSEDDVLREWGISTRLIGSYSRQTAIYPGKDVDVFARLTNLDTRVNPQDVYGRVEAVLVETYGERATAQARSIKIDFTDPADLITTDFAVDAVPAVSSGNRWAIPTKERDLWLEEARAWVETDPERFGALSSALNKATWSPTVGGRNAYKPIVKLMRQTRDIHMRRRKPGGLYVEFATHEVWSKKLVDGREWCLLFAATLRKVAERFSRASYQPLLDPGLDKPVDPPLSGYQWEYASRTFSQLADKADRALNEDDRCQAAIWWRQILGENARGQVFPLPPGCSGEGFSTATGAAVSTATPREAPGFG